MARELLLHPLPELPNERVRCRGVPETPNRVMRRRCVIENLWFIGNVGTFADRLGNSHGHVRCFAPLQVHAMRTLWCIQHARSVEISRDSHWEFGAECA